MGRTGWPRGRDVSGAAPTAGTLLQSVQRAAQLLRLVARERRPLPIRELSELLETNRSTTYHVVNTLVHEGLLRRDADGRVLLGSAIADFYHALAATVAPDERLLQALEEIGERTGETSYVGVWEGSDVVSVAAREGIGGVRVRAIALGYRQHSYARALGRALLAFRDDAFVEEYLARTPLEALTPQTVTDPALLKDLLVQARRLGVAIEREEFMPGVCCVGAPVFQGVGGDAIAALSVSVPKARFELDEQSIVDVVRDVALRATETMTNDGDASPE